jgi:hypothetical protein
MNTIRGNQVWAPRWLAGSAAVGLLMAGTRWASYIGRNPVFLTDLLLFGGILQFAASSLHRPARMAIDTRVRQVPAILLAFLLWGMVRFIISPSISLVALRDAAPYGYVTAGVLSASALRRSSLDQRARTARILEYALYFHAAWVIIVILIDPTLYLHMPHLPGRQENFLEPRPDVDEALVGVAAALLVVRALNRRQPTLTLVFFVVCWLAIIEGPSRAGQLGAGLATLLALWVGLLGRGVRLRSKYVVAVLAPLVAVVLLFAVPHTHAYSRMLGTFGLSSGDAGAAGTTSARRHSWDRLYAWDSESSSRRFVGVGFGPDFMRESGALVLLTGTDEGDQPRSPHNYWLGTLSRLGLIGVLIFGWLVLMVASAVTRCRRRIATDPLLALAAFTPTALLLPASLGVVLESPFGAIPFFWAVGLLLCYPRDSGFSSPAASTAAAPPQVPRREVAKRRPLRNDTRVSDDPPELLRHAQKPT